MPPSAPNVLLAGSDLAELDLVAGLLADEGCAVATAADGFEAATVVDVERPDALIMSAHLTGLGALDLCRHVRLRRSTMAIGVLTGDSCESVQVQNLEAGADDVIVVPVGLDALRARLRALLRRAGADPRATLVVRDVVLDTERRRVTRACRPVDLTLTEYATLELLMRNADVVLERSTMYERIWGADLHHSSKALDVHVGTLRRKLEQHGPRVVHNVRGVGYVMWSAPDPITESFGPIE
jgi:two-component system response regulator MprA